MPLADIIFDTMLGEAEVTIREIENNLSLLREERDMFRLANDETMHPFLFEKKLDEYDSRISEMEDNLAWWEAWYNDLLDNEAMECEDSLPPDPNPFDEIFYDLATIPGVKISSAWDF